MKPKLLSLIVLLLTTFTPVIAQEQHAAPPAAATAEMPGSAEELWADLMAGNKRFVAGKPAPREMVQLRQKLLQGQHPKVIVLACADSRVSPELIFDKNLGDLFVIRVAGNVADDVAMGSIEYAAAHLGSNLLVVLGHEKCGAVTAACSEEKMPTPALQAIVDKIEPAVVHAKETARPEKLIETAVRDNIHQSAKDMLSRSSILQEGMKDGKLTVIEAIYMLSTGEVVRLGKLSLMEPAFKLDIGDVMRVR